MEDIEEIRKLLDEFPVGATNMDEYNALTVDDLKLRLNVLRAKESIQKNLLEFERGVPERQRGSCDSSESSTDLSEAVYQLDDVVARFVLQQSATRMSILNTKGHLKREAEAINLSRYIIEMQELLNRLCEVHQRSLSLSAQIEQELAIHKADLKRSQRGHTKTERQIQLESKLAKKLESMNMAREIFRATCVHEPYALLEEEFLKFLEDFCVPVTEDNLEELDRKIAL